ncbi:hypothetical protein NIES73_42800 [Sphaerospermopsis kisseleviana NIES-73]|jgi:hypothetical protein|nr:hypothetical protein NIES73_42800 [Sphaerospermopsis kisseleviana NIES-73]
MYRISSLREIDFCQNQDTLREVKSQNSKNYFFSEVALIQIFQNINIKYNPVNPFILVILILTVNYTLLSALT